MRHSHRLLLAIASLLLGVTAPTVKAETLNVGYNNWIGYIGYYVAHEAGFFKEAGLDVQEKEFRAPGEGLVPLITGDLDVHLSTMDAVIQRLGAAKGSMEIIYLHDTSYGADALIGGKGITSVKHLMGKTVGVTVGECNHLLLLKALESNGLTELDVKIRNLDPDAAGSALKAGAVHAAVTWQPWITELIGEEGINTLYSTRNAPNLIVDCAVVNPKLAPKKKQAILDFIAAVNRGNELAIRDPESASLMASRRLGISEGKIFAMLEGLKLYDLAGNHDYLNGAVKEPASELAGYFMSQGVLRERPDLPALFSSTYLPPQR